MRLLHASHPNDEAMAVVSIRITSFHIIAIIPVICDHAGVPALRCDVTCSCFVGLLLETPQRLAVRDAVHEDYKDDSASGGNQHRLGHLEPAGEEQSA